MASSSSGCPSSGCSSTDCSACPTSQATPRAILIKTSFQKEDRICKIHPEDDGEINFAAAFQHLYCFIARMYCIEPGCFIVQYVDEEYDLITMMDHRDLEEALEAARIRKNQMPKVFVRLQECDSNPTYPSSDEFCKMRKYGNLQWCRFLQDIRSRTQQHAPFFSFLNEVIVSLQEGVPIDEALHSNLEDALNACKQDMFQHLLWRIQQHRNSHEKLFGRGFSPCGSRCGERRHSHSSGGSNNSCRSRDENDDGKNDDGKDDDDPQRDSEPPAE